MQEYEDNYRANTAEKRQHIQDLHNKIQEKEEDIIDVKEKREFVKARIDKLLVHKYGQFLKRVCLRAFIYHV